MRIWFDHLVIGAADLDQGARWAAETLGAAPPVGGAHPHMGTHNLLSRLPAGYVEIIATDPSAPPTARPRWYGLDDPATRARIAERPRPIAFVLATDSLEAAIDAAGWNPGEIVDAARGDLTWRMALRPDGGLAEGVLPALIEWPERIGGKAPVERMSDQGLALRALRLHAPEPDRLRVALQSLKAEEAMVEAGAPLSLHAADAPSIEAMFSNAPIDKRL